MEDLYTYMIRWPEQRNDGNRAPSPAELTLRHGTGYLGEITQKLFLKNK